MENNAKELPHIVIIGGGFGGLYAAKALKGAAVSVTLIDKRNFHLFQPLLYQVATGGLSPGDICSPLRAVLSRQKNVRVLQAEAKDILVDEHKVVLDNKDTLDYDLLIVSTGLRNHYFGHDEWAETAPGLKTLEDALEIRRRILTAFETAERANEPEKQRACLTFLIAGGGPTGVELAGALAELANYTLKNDFRSIDPGQTKILLVEGTDRLLPAYHPALSVKAKASLEELGVTVRTNTLVTKIERENAIVSDGNDSEAISNCAVLWAAGMRASRMGKVLGTHANAELDRMGRVIVNADLTVPGCPDVFVIGDLAHCVQNGNPLPGIAPVAMQQGEYVAKLIRRRLDNVTTPPFRYRDKGSLAVIGRNAAVAQLGRLRYGGLTAWLLWVFIHIIYLIEFDNKLLVLFQWAWNYFTKKRGARLITEGPNPF